MREVYQKIVGMGNVAVVTTATTGVKKDDELIAVCLIDVNPDGASSTIMRHVDQDKLSASYKYHAISGDMLDQLAMDDNAFDDRLKELLSGYDLLLTYNPEFQSQFLDTQVPMVSLPWVVKSVDDGVLTAGDIEPYEDMSAMERLVQLQCMAATKAPLPGMKKMVRVFGTWEDDASQGLLPLECNAMDLLRLLNMMRDRAT